jgi:translation initiation factor 2-alpha kinase 4
MKLAQELNEQIKADAQKQQLAKERQYKARKRANSEATEVPVSGDTPTETFNEEMEINGVRFNTVKIFHPRIGEYTARRCVIAILMSRTQSL